MKVHSFAMVLTGLGLLTACGAANLRDESSGAEIPVPDTPSAAVSTDDPGTESAPAEQNAGDVTLSEPETYSLPNLNSFTARTLDGGSFTEADLAGADVTVINIWSTTCGPCIREMPEIAEFASGLPENIRVMTWCLDAEYSPDGAQVGQFLKDCGFTGVTLTSGDGDMQAFLEQLQYTPTTVFLDAAGNLLTEPLIGAGDVEDQYTIQINIGLRKLGKERIE